MKNAFPIMLLMLAGLGVSDPGVTAEAPAIGQPAPGFSLPDQTGKLHSLDDYRSNWVVLYFYPKDETPGCTTEACEFRDNIFAFRKLNARIIGVSLDDVESHSRFAENHGLPFPLLADTDGIVADAYGVRISRNGVLRAKRETFIIDPGGKIVKHYVGVDPDTHSAEVLADLEQASTS